jgi:large repetitive protein
LDAERSRDCGADININLSGRTGFRFDDGKGGPHSRVLAWYAGTLNLADENLSVEYLSKPIENLSVLDQFSDFALSIPKDEAEEYLQSGSNLELWYSNLVHLNPSTEGIGLSWANSVQAGGMGRRAGAGATLTPVTYDNTATPRMRGDYAVSTLFDGNFDAVNDPRSFVRNTISTAIPGWSFHGGGGNNSKTLVDWREIGLATNRASAADSLSYMEQLGINTYASDYQAHYALELESGESITHNEFIVPDWGALRFDLFAPNLTGGRVNVTLDAGEGSTPFSTFVNLTPAVGSASEYLADTQRIGYGSTGFETFTFDVPDRFRGKTATLHFESSGPTVYLDNVFFKSQNLLFGNPTEARTPDAPIPNTYYNNYLLDRSQYVTSFSGDSHIPNWSAWQLNKSWLGSGNRTNYFRDPVLDNVGLITAKSSDYQRPITEIPGSLRSDGKLYILSPGHLTPNADRNRTAKDAAATFSTANLLPQHEEHNERVWLGLEDFTRDLVNNQGREVYLYAGGVGENTDKANMGIGNDRQYGSYGVQVPENLWKVFLILNRPGLGISDITTENATAFAVWTRNTIPDPIDIKWNEGGMEVISVAQLESRLNLDRNNRARGIRYNFFSNFSSDLQQALKNTPISVPPGNTPYQAFLLTEPEFLSNDIFSLGIASDTAIRHDRVMENGTYQVGGTFSSFNILPSETITDNRASQVSSSQVNVFHAGTSEISSSQSGIYEFGIIDNRVVEMSAAQVGSFEINASQVRRLEPNILKISSTEIDFFQRALSQISASQVYSTKISSFERDISSNTTLEVKPLEVSFPSSITLQQFPDSIDFLRSHNSTFQNTTLPTWLGFFQGTSPFNLNIEIKDLPTGQLAEANITSFDPTDHPNAGTLYLDTDANGLGWYIDPTPWDNSEFSQTLTDSAYRATADSLAYGHYDLLTTLLHETSHLQGFIAGYNGFDSHIQTLNGSKVFTGDGFSAILTPDGSHLSSSVYTYDLMNTTLTPGVRKLPSALDIQLLNAIHNTQFATNTAALAPTAALSAGALIGIDNGSFDTNTDWTTRGDTHILNGQAILSEDSPYLSHLSQTFVIPQGAKALQFTLVHTDLHSSNTRLAPSDAFEVALLNATTHTSVLAPLTGLSQTDALLNLQTNGQSYSSPAVTLRGVSGAEPRTVQIDVSTIAPGSVVTLYFDLLGFGAKDSSVAIDDVQLLSELSQAPIAQNDSATTNQNAPVTLDVLANDRDPDGTLNPSSLLIVQAPKHGQVSLNPNGTVTYKPAADYLGSDQFAYLIQDNSGVYSTPAVVNINILNPIPTINTVAIDSTLNEGTPANGPTNKYAGFTPLTSIPLQTISLPTYSEIKTQTLNSLVPTGTAEVVFDISRNPINTVADWNSKFLASGTAAQPKVVRVTNGLNIPSNVVLSNIVITVDNGDINFNGSGNTVNNVVLVATNGNGNLNIVNATDLRVFASGAVNMNGSAKFNGTYNLIATGTANGNVTFNGSTNSTTGTDQIRVLSGGSITFNGSSNTRGSFMAAGTFTFNGSSTLYGSISTKGNITFNGSATVFAASINETFANLAPTNLLLSASNLAENTSANTVVGTFSTTDQNTGDIHTYQLIAGTGSTDNSAFSIVGNQLILNSAANYEAKSSYSI